MSNKILKLKGSKDKNFEFSKKFKNEYLDIKENPILLQQSVLVTNLLFQIMLDLRNNMFHTDDSYIYVPAEKKKNQLRLQLWENEVIDDDKNEIKKTYKTSFFLKNGDKKQMTDALDFLKNYKNHVYSFYNKKGDKLTTSGGLIDKWYFSKKKGIFEITISLYWADKIVRLEKGLWINFRLDIAKNFSNTKQRFFVLWLMTIKKYEGTTKNYKDILELYDLSYKSAYELMRGFISPIKAKLDNNQLNDNWFSFNYFIDKNNEENIRFVPYEVKPKNEIVPNYQEKDIKKDKEKHLKNVISYKSRYIKRRHQLSTENAINFKKLYINPDYNLFEDKYKLFLRLIKRENKKAIDFKGEDFLSKFKEVYSL